MPARRTRCRVVKWRRPQATDGKRLDGSKYAPTEAYRLTSLSCAAAVYIEPTTTFGSWVWESFGTPSLRHPCAEDGECC
jgi:hypothetical protein